MMHDGLEQIGETGIEFPRIEWQEPGFDQGPGIPISRTGMGAEGR